MKTFDKETAELFEKTLEGYVECDSEYHRELFDSVRYSLLGGGKRLRPYLLTEFAKLSGGSAEDAMPFACALEMIHSYSLIHDDLPSMDNDDMRRGKPSNHKKFREGISVIAGDALQALAFDICTREDTALKVGESKALRAAFTLSRAAGIYGMCGGQAIDLLSENLCVTEDTLVRMDREKTGALISAACIMGCILGGADEKLMAAAKIYAENIGLAFQMTDDILDVESSPCVLGKNTGSDSENDKSTYVSVLGLEAAKEKSRILCEKAAEALEPYGEKAAALISLSLNLSKRKS